MTYDLFIGDRSFSSWSLRGWLTLEAFGLPVRVHTTGLYSGTFAEDLAPLAPARLVPVLRTPEGIVIGDTLAIAETLAERHPNLDFWPADPAARGLARWIVAEMHSGFQALRAECPMTLRNAWSGFSPSEAVTQDIARITDLWRVAWERFGKGETPWLFGQYSLADVFHAPVAARIAAYGLSVPEDAARYVAAHLSDPAFRRWRAMGQTVDYDPLPYAQDLPMLPWPGPEVRAARAADAGPSENTACPYSGKDVTHFLEIEGRIFGFCNAFCRDKTVADPEAWPAFMPLLERTC